MHKREEENHLPSTIKSVYEVQTKLLQLLTLALQVDDFVIVQDNIPLVRLVPAKMRKKRRIAGLHKGSMKMRAGFTDPLPDEFWNSQ